MASDRSSTQQKLTFVLPSELRSGTSDGRSVPRTDFSVMAERIGATLLYADPSRSLSRIESRVRLSVSQAVRARRVDPGRIVSLSERVGIPLALLRPHGRHVVVGHLLTSAEKRRLQTLTSFLNRIDVTLVFSRPQEQYLRDEVGLDSSHARFVYDKVDHQFFVPAPESPTRSYVLAVGRERRDYPTLINALRRTGLPGVIVAGSTWSHRTLDRFEVPDNVRLMQGLSYRDLRALYQGATLAVVPVEAGTDYAAGVNGVLEAMASGVPAIVSDTPGLTGYVTDRVDGRIVPAGDPHALAEIVAELWEDEAERESVGRAGRLTVETGRTIEMFVDEVLAALEG